MDTLADKYGFCAVSTDFNVAIDPQSSTPSPLVDLELPGTEVAVEILKYTQSNLSKETLNHSIRVFLYIRALIHDYLPTSNLDEEVVFAACLLHDIGTTPHETESSKLSFEYHGGMISHEFIMNITNGNRHYADAVAEAVFRHQNLGDSGKITVLGLLVQIATIADNVGRKDVLGYFHKDTFKIVNDAYQRDGWLYCFAGVIDKELELKPWAHSSTIENFSGKVLGNSVEYQ